jgi:hypothetical protein
MRKRGCDESATAEAHMLFSEWVSMRWGGRTGAEKLVLVQALWQAREKDWKRIAGEPLWTRNQG